MDSSLAPPHDHGRSAVSKARGAFGLFALGDQRRIKGEFRFGIVLSLLALAVSPPSALAQWGGYVFSSAEAGRDGASIYVLGASMLQTDPGWSPVFGFTTYRLRYPVAPFGTVKRWAATPSLGVQYRGNAGAIQTNVGYAWLSEGAEDSAAAPSGTRRGAAVQILSDYRPSSAVSGQAIVSYNGADRYLWSRLRGDRAVLNWRKYDLRMGLEIVAQGELDPPGTRAGYRAFQAGPLWEAGVRSLRVSGAVGWKGVEGGGGAGPYARMELVWLPQT